MASDVLSALELDKEDFDGKLILVSESAGCEANFVLSSMMSKLIRTNTAICLLTVHNDFNHYHSIGIKMGHNLKTYKENGSLMNIDYMDMISNISSETKDLSSLFELVKTSVRDLLVKHKSVCILIDDLTHLLCLDCSIRDVNLFVQECRGLLYDNLTCSLVISVHVVSDEDSSGMICNLVWYMSDLICEVRGLKMGVSKDVSGMMKIVNPGKDFSSSTLTKLQSYHYKLFDRGIKVFAPGTL